MKTGNKEWNNERRRKKQEHCVVSEGYEYNGTIDDWTTDILTKIEKTNDENPPPSRRRTRRRRRRG